MLSVYKKCGHDNNALIVYGNDLSASFYSHHDTPQPFKSNQKIQVILRFLWFHELTGACMGFIDIVFFARLYALPLKNFDQYRFYQVLSY